MWYTLITVREDLAPAPWKLNRHRFHSDGKGGFDRVYAYNLLKSNIWTDEAMKYGLSDERRHYLWWEVLRWEGRGCLTPAQVEELHKDIWWMARVATKHWW